MDKNVINRREALLGMPHSKAVQRLRKMVMFHLLQTHGENICFRCQETIDSPEDMTIEHKEPWENRNAALFWDMENISFSHARCNRPHTYPGRGKILSPEGQVWCTGCRDHVNRDEFTKNKARWNGLSYYCRGCIKKKPRKSAKRV